MGRQLNYPEGIYLKYRLVVLALVPMAYSDFTLEDLKSQFSLKLVEVMGTFSAEPIPVSDYLQETIQRNLLLATAINTEKARSEFLIAPVLAELKQINPNISLFSGTEFTVDKERGLNGTCDFLISRSSEQLTIEAPVAAIVEAKKENLNAAIPQCIAEMVAAQTFNLRKGKPIESIYGIVTSGSIWRFLRLIEHTVTIDLKEVYLSPLEVLLGILMSTLKE